MHISSFSHRTASAGVAACISAAFALVFSSATAQDVSPAFPTNTPNPDPGAPPMVVLTQEILPEVTPVLLAATVAPPAPLPPAVRLEGLSPVYQQLNRCSAAALTIQLSYFDWDGDYTRTINGLNPHIEDVAVRLDEMAAFARTQGLGAVERLGGNADLIKTLVAAGFPVLVEQSYFEGGGGLRDWLGHNRVVMGYDDAVGEFYTYDSLLGNGNDNRGRPIAYADFDDKWRAFNRDYLVLYRPEDEARVQAILGDNWDVTLNAQNTYLAAAQDLANGLDDGFTHFNMGTALTVLGEYEEAALAFDTAETRELPWRMLWYQYGPLQANYALGRYNDVIADANVILATTPGVEEAYYYLGVANEGLGNMEAAENYLEAALRRNQFYADATVALNRVRAVVGTSGSAGA